MIVATGHLTLSHHSVDGFRLLCSNWKRILTANSMWICIPRAGVITCKQRGWQEGRQIAEKNFRTCGYSTSRIPSFCYCKKVNKCDIQGGTVFIFFNVKPFHRMCAIMCRRKTRTQVQSQRQRPIGHDIVISGLREPDIWWARPFAFDKTQPVTQMLGSLHHARLGCILAITHVSPLVFFAPALMSA